MTAGRRRAFPIGKRLQHAITRHFASFPGDCKWNALKVGERQAWETLGWDQTKWDTRDNRSLTPWSSLSSVQKASIEKGLGITSYMWEKEESRRMGRRARETSLAGGGGPATPPPPVRVDILSSTQQQNASGSLISRLVQAMSRVVTPPDNNMPAEPYTEATAPVVVDSVETTLYLDDSRSMREFINWWNKTTRLSQAKEVLRWLVPAIGAVPCRILTFSGTAQLVRPRTATTTSAQSTCSIVHEAWSGRGTGGTYMWHMIEQDVLRRYHPGKSKLRLIVITDGDDNASPMEEYMGMEGMNPMMQTLHEAGYDIEWHIIVVGDESGLEAYETLAGATGGTFLCVKHSFDPHSRALQSMLQAIENSTDAQGRRDRQRNYESKAQTGNRQKWFKQLPP